MRQFQTNHRSYVPYQSHIIWRDNLTYNARRRSPGGSPVTAGTNGGSIDSTSTYHTIISSQSLSILPAKPKIFHGRDSELQHIVEQLTRTSAYIAILGAGGIGKTSLARAVLHDLGICKKYEHRVFVACDSATTSVELAAVVGSNAGLEPGQDLTKTVVQHFSNAPPCLLVLDNLESTWEKPESRGAVEEFLSLLTGVPQLALMVSHLGISFVLQ
jgi:hypothetical protein